MTDRSKERTKREKFEGIQNLLEHHKKFGWETIAYGDNWTMPDKTFRYKKPWYECVETAFWRGLLCILGPVLVKVGFGAKVVGKENLKKVKGNGAITLCNHIHFLDTLFIRQAIGHIDTYHTMAPWNNKTGLGGHIIRHGGMLPFSSDITAMRNLSDEIERQLKRGKLVNFYPERSLWWNYQKPRPMKDGAFHYAVKFGVPVLPVFCTFEKSKRGGMKKLVINILPPIYAEDSLPKKERMNDMKLQAENSWKECYERAYGKPLEYL